MEVCRVCLKKGQLTSIYEKDLNNITLCDKIMECGGISIRPSMDLPEFICAKCLTNLDVAYSFRTTCKKSDSILQIYLKANNKNNIFVTLSSGKMYKLPVDLKLKIIKVNKGCPKESNKTEEVNLPLETNDVVEDSLADDNKEDRLSEVQEPEETNIIMENKENKILEVNVNEISNETDYESEDDNDFGVEMLEESEDDKQNTENAENVQPQSDDEDSKQNSEDEKLPVKSKKKKHVSTKRRKGHIPLNKIIRQVKGSTPPKYLQKNSDSEEDTQQEMKSEPKEKVLRRTEDKPSFICEICGNVYKQNGLLQTHMRRHNNERPFSCEICGKSFVTSSLMARHIKIHTGHKPFKCQFCNRRFYERGTCRAHEKVHSGERPYECRECGKRFIYSQSLTKHMLIHTGEKLYSCDLCGKEFRLYHHLKAHLQTNVHKHSSTSDVAN